MKLSESSLRSVTTSIHSSGSFQQKTFNNINEINYDSKSIEKRVRFIQEIINPEIFKTANETIRKRNKNCNSKHNTTMNLEQEVIFMLNISIKKTKLAPQYFGPFKVVGRTKGGSYILSNAITVPIPRGFAPFQLKESFATIATNSFFVESIQENQVQSNRKCGL